MNEREFGTHLSVDETTLRRWLDRGWISPLTAGGTPRFQEVDVARAALILDLDELGVNDDGIDVVLDLLDQVHSLRQFLNGLIQALDAQPRDLRRHIVNDAHRLDTLRRHRSIRLADERPRSY